MEEDTWKFSQCFGDKTDTIDVAEGTNAHAYFLATLTTTLQRCLPLRFPSGHNFNGKV